IESKTETADDDYGLFEARLIGTPLESGLAAVFGVVLVAFVANSTSGVQPQPALSLTDIFSPTNVGAYVTAAAFGLAPNLLIRGLNNQIADIQKSLASSQSAGAVEKKDGDDSGSGDGTGTGGH